MPQVQGVFLTCGRSTTVITEEFRVSEKIFIARKVLLQGNAFSIEDTQMLFMAWMGHSNLGYFPIAHFSHGCSIQRRDTKMKTNASRQLSNSFVSHVLLKCLQGLFFVTNIKASSRLHFTFGVNP